MARVGLLGRIMLVLLGALSFLVVATFGIDQWQRGQERWPYGSRFPRLDQAAGIMSLMKDADPAQRPAILRAVNGEALRAEITDAPPDETALIREPVLEARLRRLTGDEADGIQAFTTTDMLYRGKGPADAGAGNRHRSIGSLAQKFACPSPVCRLEWPVAWPWPGRVRGHGVIGGDRTARPGTLPGPDAASHRSVKVAVSVLPR